MYSVVLAAMLTTTPATPQWGWHHGCHGCHGCWSCWGCYGGCYGCWGCWGGWGYAGPAYYGWGWPGYGGWGGYYGWGCGGAFGCAGGAYACIGCYGTYGWGGYYVATTPVLAPPRSTDGGTRTTSYASAPSQAPATVMVQAPENARVFVEGKQVALKSDGSFTTPRLEPGQAYTYRIRAEVLHEGRPVSETKNLRVWAGKTSRIAFPELQPEEAVAADAPPATARITVRLPQDAKLFINDALCPLKSASRSFDTPQLDPRRNYTYTLKAEVVRDGRKRVEKKTIAFRAGQPVTVDFRDLEAVQTAGR